MRMTANRWNTSPRTITVVSAIGTGSTLLSSFDDALQRCGVCNYNLILLSSVIPPGTRIDPAERYDAPHDEFGHRLYVVKADMRSAVDGDAVAAGIGWYQWGDSRGVFVEHELMGTSVADARAELTEMIHQSLHDLCSVRGIPFDPVRVGCCITSAETGGKPTTALVLAVYEAEGWR